MNYRYSLKDILIFMEKSNYPFYPLLNNYNKIEKIFGKDFLNKSANDTLNYEDFIYANYVLSVATYGEDIAKMIAERNIVGLDKSYQELLFNIPKNESVIDFNLDEVGMVLIRPEVLGEKEKYKELLKSLKLFLLLEKDFKISFDQYRVLYHHGLKHKDTILDFPTRTFNYVDNDVCMLVVTGNRNELQVPTISDYLFKYKGNHGTYTKNTLRGDIAFKSLEKYTLSNNSFKKEANVPLDPIGAYRMIVRGNIESDRCHEIAEDPLLYYSAQAVHIPNRYELSKDFNVLCDDKDIELISNKMRKR